MYLVEAKIKEPSDRSHGTVSFWRTWGPILRFGACASMQLAEYSTVQQPLCSRMHPCQRRMSSPCEAIRVVACSSL